MSQNASLAFLTEVKDYTFSPEYKQTLVRFEEIQIFKQDTYVFQTLSDWAASY